MKLKKFYSENKWLAITLSICIGVTLFVVLMNLPAVLSAVGKFLLVFRPVFLGILLAYILNPLTNLLEKRVFVWIKKEGTRHGISVAFTLILLVLLFVLLGIFLIPNLVSSVRTFIENLETYTKSLQEVIDQINAFLAERGINADNVFSLTGNFLDFVRGFLPDSLRDIVSVVGSIVTNIFDVVVAFIITGYCLADKERLLRGCKNLLKALMKTETYAKTKSFLQRGHNILIRYIIFSLLDALIIGTANFIFMRIAGLPYSGIISLVVAVTNLAPTFGPIIGGAIGAFILVLVNPWYALYFLIFTVILQTFDGYILKPRMYGGGLGVPGVVILVCIIIGGRL
ncbi:MAG: AI-2E family transporter, partial [Eubacterium sp.]|nr:AI-2E family transporter [Eubacterium sp.]